MRKGLKIEVEKCKPLNLFNGKLDCKKDGKNLSKDLRFQQGAECKNICNNGFKLRKNAPVAKKCVCRGGKGCKWIRNAQAKCIRVGSGFLIAFSY